MDLQTFNALVTRMQSADNNDRTAAEKQYDEVEIGQKVSLLFQLYREQSAAVEARSMSLVLLRRLISNDWETIWSNLDDAHKQQFLDEILKSAMEETDTLLRKRVADLLAEVARCTIDEETGKQQWSRIFEYIEHCAASESAELKLTAMILIENVPNVFGSDQDQYLPGIKAILESCLHHTVAQVRAQAVKAYVSFVCDNDDDDKAIKMLAASIPTVIEICKHVVQTEEEDDSPLQCLADLASMVPKIITPHLNSVLELCSQTISNTEKDSSYRHSALEVITSFVETAPATVKKRAANSIPVILHSALLLMTELDEEIEDWLAVDDADHFDDEDSAGVGESSLDRICCALNGKVLLQPLQQVVQQLLSEKSWQKRHAGLMALSTAGEGCHRAMEPHIATFVNTIIPFLKDPHPRVRYAACNAIGQMSTDFAPTLQKKCHEKVVPALLAILEDTTCPRVSAHAGAALVNFTEDCPKQVISAYLPVMMAKLEFVLDTTFKHLLERGKKIVLEQVITTIASVADAAQDLFIQYYERLMPPLKFILENSEAPDFKTLRGKTIECISLIGLAVGKETFKNDAMIIMKMLSGQMPHLEPDDPQCSYMISSWTRICKVLGSDFAPFMPLVMEPIMKAAKYTPDVTVVPDEDVNEDQEGWSFTPMGDNQSLGIRTSGLEEKATAFEMIICYARELKESFAPYVEQVSEMMLNHLKFVFHDSVRSSAAEVFPLLIDCVAHLGLDAKRALWTSFFPAVCAAIEAEMDVEVTSEFLSAIAECIEKMGPDGVTGEEMQKVMEVASKQLEEYEQRKLDGEAQEADEDADPEETKEQLDEEAELEAAVLARVSDIIHSSFKTFGEQFFPLVQPLLPGVKKLVDCKRSYTDRQWGICIFDDLIEYAPKQAAGFQSEFVPQLIAGLADEYPEVRQAAAYGIGIMAMNGGADFLQAVTTSLEPLAQMISKPDARSTEESTIATENAISAVSKILKYAGSQVDITQVIPSFISWLPTHEDQDESAYIYGYFCDLIESNHPNVLGQDNSNLPRILDIVVSAFHLDAFGDAEGTAEVKERMKNIIRLLSANQEMFMQVVTAAALGEEKQQTLQQLMS